MIIPVRLGSKRLRNKNILQLKICQCLFVAKNVVKSKHNLNVFISSESEEIRVICKNIILIL